MGGTPFFLVELTLLFFHYYICAMLLTPEENAALKRVKNVFKEEVFTEKSAETAQETEVQVEVKGKKMVVSK